MPERPRVLVERDLCISAGYCLQIAPLTFAFDGDGISIVTDARAATDDQLREAVETCPSGAVRAEV